jgi:cation diffusion facilitator CzcD-associated flavoprotein CzcO
MPISEVYKKPYKVIEQWHSQPRHVRIIAVGAGASGLCVAYKAQRNLRNYELQVYEK